MNYLMVQRYLPSFQFESPHVLRPQSRVPFSFFGALDGYVQHCVEHYQNEYKILLISGLSLPFSSVCDSGWICETLWGAYSLQGEVYQERSQATNGHNVLLDLWNLYT